MNPITVDQQYHTAYVSIAPDNDTVSLESMCVLCQSADRVDVDLTNYASWVQGAGPIQRLFPTMTPGRREQFFKTGICGSCWDHMFGEEE